MFELTREFWIVTIDHFVVHWGLCMVLFLVDTFLYTIDKKWWNHLKLNYYSVPDTWKNIIKIVLCNQIFVSIANRLIDSSNPCK